MENKSTFTAEEFKALCREAIPALEQLQGVLRKHGVNDYASIYISEDGHISMEGSGFHGWEMRKHSEDKAYSARYQYVERFSVDEGVQE